MNIQNLKRHAYRHVHGAVLGSLILTAAAPVGAEPNRTEPAKDRDVTEVIKKVLWQSGDRAGLWRYGDGYIPKEGWKIISTNRPDWSDTFKAVHAIDDDLDTYWYQHGVAVHEMVIDLGRTYELAALSLLTVDRGADRIKRVEIFISNTPEAKGTPTASGTLSAHQDYEHFIEFKPTSGRYLIMRAPVESSEGFKSRIAVSELNLVEAKTVAQVAQEMAMREQENLARAQARSRNWQGRSSSEVIDAVAKDFIQLLSLEDMSALRHRKEIVEVQKLVTLDKHAEALTVFRDYFFNKLRYPNLYGLTTYDVSPFSKGIAGLGKRNSCLNPEADRRQVLAVADKLMVGEMELGGKPIQIGPPGEVDWLQSIKREDLWDPNKMPYSQLTDASGFFPLVHAWLLTHDQKYLVRWFDYMDDWTMNEDYRDSIHPSFVPMRGRASAIPLLRLLGGIAAVATDPEVIPPATMARILKKVIRDSLLNISYLRSNTHNWSPSPREILVALILDEFKAAPVLFRECRRRSIEDNAVTQNLRDGTENQQCPWYNDHYLWVSSFQDLMEARQNFPAWEEQSWVREMRMGLDWRQEMDEHLNARINYFLHLRTPQNEWPIGVRGGDKRQSTGTDAEYRSGNLYAIGKDAYQDPENQRIVATIKNPDSAVRPTYTSEWFPYAGYNLVREGWERDNGYGFLFCSPHPGAYGAFRSRSNNSSFGLGGFGQDLLVSDCVGHYMYPDSPIKVDGLSQFFHAGYYKVSNPARHKAWLVSAWTEPSPWRWHASEYFNLMEGKYSGAWDNAGSMKALKDCLTGPAHQRQVHYVREAGVWIITDRMAAGGAERSYDQVWRLPIKPSGTDAFDRDEIVVDPDARRIATVSEADRKANISLQQFSRQELSYAEKIIEKNPKNRYQAYGRKDIHVTWQADGHSQVLTVIYPREAGMPDLVGLRPIVGEGDTYGFACEAPNGTHIQYQASAGSDAELEIGPVRMQGESLLLTRAKDSTDIRGVALGCTHLAIDGKSVSVANPDFEFSLPSTLDLRTRPSKLALTPIWRPISPVKISPERNLFIDNIELEMTSDTPQVEIRYTLDGTDPTPRSTLYTSPFTLRHSAVVKARAYRPGVTENPVQLSGTHATVVTRAVFDRSPPQESLGSMAGETGIAYKYYKGDWKDLWLFRDTIKPVKEGVASELFDLSIIPETNPPVGDAAAPRSKSFAIEYTGTLDIPEDGVYTLHAPREFVYPDTDAGYELQVYLGRVLGVGDRLAGYQQWYPATRLHAFGNWSIALKKGSHPFKLVYLDYRSDAPLRLNRPDIRDYIWSGVTPELKISGPGLEPQAIPAAWLRH